jgi:hypothetical protein
MSRGYLRAAFFVTLTKNVSKLLQNHQRLVYMNDNERSKNAVSVTGIDKEFRGTNAERAIDSFVMCGEQRKYAE